MAVEARHLNLFPSHLLCAREMLNPATENVVPNLHNSPAGMMAIGGGGGVAPTTESVLPFYNGQFGDAVMQRLTKTMNNQMTNPPLKDDSGLTFNNNVALPFPRKRPREAAIGVSTTTSNRNGNNALVSVPNGIAGKVTGGAGSFSFLGEDMSLQMMQQQLDFDRLVSLHMDKVRLEIEERHRIQSRRLFGTIDESISKRLRQKEEQIERIGKLNCALEERAKSLYLENQIWRDLAQTHEATANALRSNLELVLAQVNNTDRIRSGEDDAESCCGSSGDAAHDDRDEAEGEPILRWRKVEGTIAGGERKAVDEEERRKRMCRRCGETESSVLVLPCRHLCLCSACGPSVDTCPICNSTKNASVHVNFS